MQDDEKSDIRKETKTLVFPEMQQSVHAFVESVPAEKIQSLKENQIASCLKRISDLKKYGWPVCTLVTRCRDCYLHQDNIAELCDYLDRNPKNSD